MMQWRRSLAAQLALRVLPVIFATAIAALVLEHLLGDAWLAGVISAGLGALLLAWRVSAWLSPMLSLFRALQGTAYSYRDGDYSFGLRWPKNDELADLVAGHNAIGQALRDKHMGLVQRELLLDTMVQNTPVAMLLIDQSARVVFANLAARKLVGGGRRIEGHALAALCGALDASLGEALRMEQAGVFSTGTGEEEEVYHLTRSEFRLNGQAHRLLLVRQITTELRRQEVQTWKKVIRVISHELNNSLAPMASLAHSGAELARRGQVDRLPGVFATIEERARHLDGFLRDYARFAKLPQPRIEGIDLSVFVERLQSQISFNVVGKLPEALFPADAAQLEQALLNLLKNAQEASAESADVELQIRHADRLWRIDVLDCGTGMSDAVMANALVPFYSTKRSGTGLGLALTREIIEAHGGRIVLANREGGGLCVSLILPA